MHDRREAAMTRISIFQKTIRGLTRATLVFPRHGFQTINILHNLKGKLANQCLMKVAAYALFEWETRCE
jgi:hypothetical protein